MKKILAVIALAGLLAGCDANKDKDMSSAPASTNTPPSTNKP